MELTENENEKGYNYKAICCENIPELFLDKLVARKHFSQFGNITRFILRPSRLSCTVAFENERQAERALLEGYIFNGHMFQIDYAQHEKSNAKNMEDWVNSEVQAELDAISGVWRNEISPPATSQATAGSMPAPYKQTLAMANRNGGGKSSPPFPYMPFSSAELRNTNRSSPLTSSANPAVAAKPAEHRNANPNVKQDLMAIMRRPAFKSEDKYRVLDARDKLVRIMMSRKADIVSANATKGTCPDMCPEKERLLREYQRQVASFEMNNDVEGDQRISHRRAVKEYSRSSADQDSPLAHELRSTDVLHMTMVYLLHEIVNMPEDPEVSLGEWFHFLWDRTRSIRKDITQQELCSPSAVKLVEQCARFHIHCGACLVNADTSVFDPKINAENLTKCLQTLKYMYHDLRLKNIDCVAEPEFRSYIVLLNLRDANFLWEIKQLPVHIQRSPEIRRAILFYHALQDNNFVRFFNMIRNPATSYLSACILLGYFNRLRIRAMEIFIKSHKWSKNNASLPISHIERVLGFEDDYATEEFLQAHGLKCDHDRVVLQRLKMPETEYKMDRAYLLVESKLAVSIGECVYGERLPPAEIFQRHRPCNSFGDGGLLKPEAWMAVDQLHSADIGSSCPALPQAKTKKMPSTQSRTGMSPPTVKPPNAAPRTNTSGFNIFKIPRASPPMSPKQPHASSHQPFQKQPQEQQMPQANIFNFGPVTPAASDAISSSPICNTNVFQPIAPIAPVESMLVPQANKPTASLSFQQPAAAQQPSSIRFSVPCAQTESPKTGIFSSALAVVKAEQLASEQTRKQAEVAARAKVETEAAALAAAEAAERLKQRQIVVVRRTTANFLKEHLWHELRAIVTDVYARELSRQTTLKQLANRIFEHTYQEYFEAVVRDTLAACFHEQRLLVHCLNVWLDFVHKQKLERERLESVPLWLSTGTRQQQATQIVLRNAHVPGDLMRRYRHGSACDFQDLLQRPQQAAAALPLPMTAPAPAPAPGRSKAVRLHLWRLLADVLPTRKVGAVHYCKLLCTLPGENEELLGFRSLCEKWLSDELLCTVASVGNGDSSATLPIAEAATGAPAEAFVNHLAHNVALCIRKVYGVSPTNEQGAQASEAELAFCDGIVCFMTPAAVRLTYERLRNVRRSSRRVVFLVYDGEHVTAERLAQQLQLAQRFDFEDYQFFGCRRSRANFNFGGLLRRAVAYLAKRTAVAHNKKWTALAQQALPAFAHVQLGEELWQRWLSSATRNLAFERACQQANVIVELYNECAARLQQIAGEDFSQEQRLPSELQRYVETHVPLDVPRQLEHFVPDWHTASYRKQLVKFFESVKLPKFPELKLPALPTAAAAKGFEESLYLWLLDYANVCLAPRQRGQTHRQHEEHLTQTTYSAIQTLVVEMNRDELQDLSLPERLKQINYLRLVKCFAVERLSASLRGQHPPAVVYRCKRLRCHQAIPWWLNFGPVAAITFERRRPPPAAEERKSKGDGDAKERKRQPPTHALVSVRGDLLEKPPTDFATIVSRAETVCANYDAIMEQAQLQHTNAAKRKVFMLSNGNALAHAFDDPITVFNATDQLSREMDDLQADYNNANADGVADGSVAAMQPPHNAANNENTPPNDCDASYSPFTKRAKYAAAGQAETISTVSSSPLPTENTDADADEDADTTQAIIARAKKLLHRIDGATHDETAQTSGQNNSL